jgi:hypothetical protein
MADVYVRPKRTAQRLAAQLALSTPDYRPAEWVIGTGSINWWDRWWLLRHLRVLAPANVSVRGEPFLSGWDESSEVFVLPCFVFLPEHAATVITDPPKGPPAA